MRCISTSPCGLSCLTYTLDHETAQDRLYLLSGAHPCPCHSTEHLGEGMAMFITSSKASRPDTLPVIRGREVEGSGPYVGGLESCPSSGSDVGASVLTGGPVYVGTQLWVPA